MSHFVHDALRHGPTQAEPDPTEHEGHLLDRAPPHRQAPQDGNTVPVQHLRPGVVHQRSQGSQRQAVGTGLHRVQAICGQLTGCRLEVGQGRRPGCPR